MKKLTMIILYTLSAPIVCAMEEVAASYVLAALGKVETGADDVRYFIPADRKVGAKGEITRYQILPSNLTPSERATKPRREVIEYVIWSRKVARRILNDRADLFFDQYKRIPDARETYILWNAPAYLIFRESLTDFNLPVPKAVERKAKKFVEALKEETRTITK
jgi:hypothetical protein